MKFAKVQSTMNTYGVENEDSNLMKVKIVVMHEKRNRNGTSFSVESMRDAEDTIKNTPILAYVLRDTDGEISDFDEHNMETRIKDSNDGFVVETYYQEKPIGVIPESCNPRYEEINGVQHFVVDGYIWKTYSNGSYKLLNETKGLSMEVEILDGQFNEVDDVYDITKFRYLGVTCLGDHVEQGMNGTASISRYSVSADYKDALADIYKEIYSLERKEDKPLENEEIVQDEVVVEEVEVTEEDVKVEEVVETEEITEGVDEDGEVQTEEKEEEKEEIIEDAVVEEVVSEFSLDVFGALFEEVPETLEKIVGELTERFSKLNEKLSELEQFKADRELQELKVEVENVASKFNLEMDLSEMKEKVYSKEMTLEAFEKELKILDYDNIANKFSKDTKEDPVRIAIRTYANNEELLYGGLFEKHGLFK